MNRFLAYMRGLLRSPSSYTAQPWAYARNQVGHGAMGGLVADIAVRWLDGWATVALIAGGMMLYLAVEYYQWLNRDAEAWDNLEDIGHVWAWVMALICLHVASWPLALGVWMIGLLLLASGVLRRISEQGQGD